MIVQPKRKDTFCLARAQPVRDSHNSANEKSFNSSNGLFPVAHPTSFSPLQRSPPLCARGDLHSAHHDCRCPNCNCLLILKKLIFAGEISGSLFCFRSKHCSSFFMTCYLRDYEFSLLLDEWMLWQC